MVGIRPIDESNDETGVEQRGISHADQGSSRRVRRERLALSARSYC
jgi:hypothetical protein